jgi:hypothetical protein
MHLNVLARKIQPVAKFSSISPYQKNIVLLLLSMQIPARKKEKELNLGTENIL